jgi:hypothetical protein
MRRAAARCRSYGLCGRNRTMMNRAGALLALPRSEVWPAGIHTGRREISECGLRLRPSAHDRTRNHQFRAWLFRAGNDSPRCSSPSAAIAPPRNIEPGRLPVSPSSSDPSEVGVQELDCNVAVVILRSLRKPPATALVFLGQALETRFASVDLEALDRRFAVVPNDDFDVLPGNGHETVQELHKSVLAGMQRQTERRAPDRFRGAGDGVAPWQFRRAAAPRPAHSLRASQSAGPVAWLDFRASQVLLQCSAQ